MSLDLESLLEQLDQLGGSARACVLPFTIPNAGPLIAPRMTVCWSGRGRPAGGFIRSAAWILPRSRSRRRGAAWRSEPAGSSSHRAHKAFGFGDSAAAEAIFEVAGEAGVPILIHAGRGMPTMAPLADLALRHPEVALVLAHAGTADMGVFAARLAEHPRVVYDTSCMAVDLIELLSRVPVERVVFGSDPPYGRPASGMFQMLRVARYAGLGAAEVALLTGGTITALLEDRQLHHRRLLGFHKYGWSTAGCHASPPTC